MTVKLHDKQLEVANDTHRFRVICAGRRWGKSTLAQLIILQWALQNSGLYWIVSPTYRAGKMVHWKALKQIIPRSWIFKTNEVELSITLRNPKQPSEAGSVIELKGAENPDALRGVKLRGLVIDEIASIRNWDWLWDEVLRPTLTDYEAPALFISTPKGFNHFYELYLAGQTGSQFYRSWRFTSYDNPYIPKAEIDAARKELTEDTFYQEYMADFRKFTGLVYKAFDRTLHVIQPFDIPDSWAIYRGIDFGSTNPTACVWVAVDPDDNWFICDEHYAKGEPLDYHAGVINSNRYSPRVVSTYGDPSGAQWITEFAGKGVFITPANKEIGTGFSLWVNYGINQVAEKLKAMPGHTVPSIPQGAEPSGPQLPQLFVFASCTNVVREFESYRWKEKSVSQAQDLNEPDVPEKANDHAMDALRYFAVSYQKRITPSGGIPYSPNKGWGYYGPEAYQ